MVHSDLASYGEVTSFLLSILRLLLPFELLAACPASVHDLVQKGQQPRCCARQVTVGCNKDEGTTALPAVKSVHKQRVPR